MDVKEAAASVVIFDLDGQPRKTKSQKNTSLTKINDINIANVKEKSRPKKEIRLGTPWYAFSKPRKMILALGKVSFFFFFLCSCGV